MNLKEFLQKKRLLTSEFRKQHCISASSMRRLLTGTPVGMSLARKIEKVTEGSVTVEELMDGYESRWRKNGAL
jgi:hypothetical protein